MNGRWPAERSGSVKAGPIALAALGLGILAVIAGLLLQSTDIIHFLNPTPSGKMAQLVLGATFFRIGLLGLGLITIVLARSTIWRQSGGASSLAVSPSRSASLLIAGIIVSAAVLRLYRLNTGLWFDEIVTDMLYARSPFGTILTTYESENQHFLYSLLAQGSYQLFGISNWALRLPAVLFGMGSIWALFLFGREVTSTSESLLATALMAFSYQHLWFSQNARGYTGLLFWTMLASWYLVRALREGRAQLWVLYAICAALGVYTHVTMLFVIAGHFAVWLITLVARRQKPQRTGLNGLLLGFGLAGFLALFLYSLVLPQVLGGMGREASLVVAWKNPLWTLAELLNGMEISFARGFVALAGLLVFGAGAVSYLRSEQAVLTLFVVPIAVCAAVVIGLGHHLWPRFFFFALGFGVLIVMRGAIVLGQWALTRLLRWPARRSQMVSIGLGVAMIAISTATIPFAYGPKQDYVGARDYVEASRQPGDVVVTSGVAELPYTQYYGTGWQVVNNLPQLNRVRAQAAHTWFVYTFPPVLESTAPDIAATLGNEFQVVKEFNGTLNGGTVYVARSVDQGVGRAATTTGSAP